MKNKRIIIFEILAIILIMAFCIYLTPVKLQNDTFYTIKIGELIIENGGIDMMDHFSWHEGLEYTYPHWLYDVIIYLIYNINGLEGVFISTCLLAVILGLTIYKTNSRLFNNKVTSFFITIGVMYLLRDYIAARAQLVTFILFTLQIFLIEKMIKTNNKKYGIGLILISIAIANLHVAVWPFSFILYLPYIAEYLASILLAKMVNKSRITFKRKDIIKFLIIIMLICLLTGFLTPLGTTPYTYLIKTMQGNTTDYITEHLPLTLIEHVDIICVLVIFLFILLFTNTKIRLSDLLMFGGLTLLMFFSERQLTMFVIIGSFILNRFICNFKKRQLMKVVTTKFVTIWMCIGIVVLVINILNTKVNQLYIDETKYPVSMSMRVLTYFEENNINIENVRIYNGYNYGSYLLYQGIPVFIDSRCDLYAPEYNGGQDIFSDAVQSSKVNIWFEDILKKYDITHLLLHKQSKTNMIIQKGNLDGYNLLIEDSYFAFYEVNL